MSRTAYGTMYYVDDMPRAVGFYKTVLGVNPGHESPDWTEFPLGSHNLCLHAKRGDQSDYPANGILIFNHDGIKALYAKMKQDGLNVFGLHQVHPAAWSFHLKDASENETSFYGAP